MEKMNIIEIRKLFPHLSTDQIYFNHAALGPWSTLALNRISEYSAQRSGGKIENYPYFLKWNSGAKVKLGKILGSTSDRLAWVDNVSNGLNILAQGLSWKKGDRIILNDIEFPSNIYPFLNLQKYGVEIDLIKSRNGIVDLDDIEKVYTPRTKLISISLVQFLSGYRADMDAIGEFCKQAGIIFCVDAIQGAGAVQIDVNRSKIDFLSGGTQKWLMSSQGLSYIYITEELQSWIEQKNVGWASVENAWSLLEYDLTLKSTADRFQNGTVNALGVAIFDSVIDLFIDFGMENVEQKILANTNFFIKNLNRIGIKSVLENAVEKNRAGIVTFKDQNAKRIFDELEKRKIYAAVREGMIRFAPHFYNTNEEIERVVDELEIILKGI
jgi:selenocysteine lyase/cysteine desulfurase